MIIWYSYNMFQIVANDDTQAMTTTVHIIRWWFWWLGWGRVGMIVRLLVGSILMGALSPQKIPSYPATVLGDLPLEMVYGGPVDARIKSHFPGLVGNKPVKLVE